VRSQFSPAAGVRAAQIASACAIASLAQRA